MSSASADAVIRYTTDGTHPTASEGRIYTDPILIDTTTIVRAIAVMDGQLASEVTTRSYIFLNDVVRQPRSPAGFPSHWGDFPADYAMFIRTGSDPDAVAKVFDGLRSIPTMSIVTDPDDLFGSEGIYANPQQRGRNWERLASVEIINTNGTLAYQANAGIRIHGNSTRDPEITPKHNFRLNFRNEYGASKLDYPLFTDSPVAQFDDIVLRAG